MLTKALMNAEELTRPTRPHARNGAGVLPEKKRKREARIIRAAARLFARHGYTQTSMEAIAQQADVAVGTVYNYFRNKPALLMRVLTDGRGESLRASAALACDPPLDPIEATYQLLSAQMVGANRHDKGLWRVIHATAALEPEAFGHDYFSGKEQFTTVIVQLLETLQSRGQLPDTVEITPLSTALKYIASEVFRRYVADDSISLEDALSDLKTLTRFIMSSTLK